MVRTISPRLARSLSLSAINVDETKRRMRETPEAAEYRKEQENLTNIILKAVNSAKRVEDLVYLEMALQKMDYALAQTEQERGSIDKAQIAYHELMYAIDQMRNSPAEYFKANLSISSQDMKKMPDVRGPMKIRSNKARLQNRAMFAEEEDRKVWNARIAAADRTESMLRTLHKDLATSLEG